MTPFPGLDALSAALALETARLRLRPFAETDLDALARIHADADTMRYIGEGKTLNRSETWRAIAGTLGHWLLRGYGMWGVELKGTHEFIGRVGFYYPDGWPGFELGWMITREHWGRGYATEGAQAALEYAFTTLKRERVISLIRPANLPSVRVAEKLGATLQGEVELSGALAKIYAIDRGAV
jgi:RimJ/RimL family protein N-acetyltransferase